MCASERERDRQTDRQTEREGGGGGRGRGGGIGKFFSLHAKLQTTCILKQFKIMSLCLGRGNCKLYNADSLSCPFVYVFSMTFRLCKLIL